MNKSWFFDPLKPGKYNVINADVPSSFKSFTPFETAKGPQYPVMSDSWIRDLPVRHLAAADCLLWMWATLPKLCDYLSYMDAWGFRYVTGGVWVKRTRHGKVSFGTGHVVQGGAELWLLGAIGRPFYVNRPIKGVIETEEAHDAELLATLFEGNAFDGLRREHSRKPDEQYALIDQLMGDDPVAVPRCEIFARQQWPGYDAWGNQADHFKPMGGAE